MVAAVAKNIRFACDACTNCFLTKDVFDVTDIMDYDLIMQRDRGGLYLPSDLSRVLSTYCCQLFYAVKAMNNSSIFDASILQAITLQHLAQNSQLVDIDQLFFANSHSLRTYAEVII